MSLTDSPRRTFGAPRVVLLLLCAMYFIFFADRVNISTLAPMIKTDLRLSNTQLGLAFSVFAAPYALFQLVGGWLADRFGARLTLTICCAIVGVSTLLTGVVGGMTSLLAARLAPGFGEGAGFPTATRAMANWTPRENWGFAQGIAHSFSRLANAITPPVAALLLLIVSWRGVFRVMGVASFIWVLAWAWFYRDDPRKHPSVRLSETTNLPTATVQIPSRATWLRLAWHILPVTIVDFCYGWTLWLFLSWIPTFFLENYHLQLQASALFTAGVLFAGVIGDTLGGTASDWLFRRTGDVVFARRSVLVTGFAGAFLFLLPVMLIHNLRVSAVCLSLAFFFAELIVGPIWAVPMDMAPDYAGTASGMMNFGFAIAGLVSPSSFGYLVDRTGSWIVPFSGSVVLLLVGAALAIRLNPGKRFDAAMPAFRTEVLGSASVRSATQSDY